MQKQKATIIGGHGFIGRHLVTRLLATGWDCHVPARQEACDVQGEMGHVFYCAGLTSDYIKRPYDTVEAHVSLLSRILRSGRFKSLVYLSSTRLYDSQPESVGSEERPLLLDPTNPRHLYDFSKALGESLCLVMGNGRARIARLSCVYNDYTDEYGFLPGLLRQIIGNTPALLKVDSSPDIVRDYVHLEDVLDALIMIATQGEGCIYNVASGENISNETLFSVLTKVSGCKFIPLLDDKFPSPPKISIKKIKDEFGWRPVSVLKKITLIIEENW